MRKFYLNDIEELTEDKMRKIVFTWTSEVEPILEQYKEYYAGQQEILNKYQADTTKPCNKLVANFAYDITENYAGYLAGIPIGYVSEDDITDILEILKINDVHNEDNDFLRDALIYGQAFELCYLDSTAQQKFKRLSPKECIPIYQNDLEEDLLAVMRIYSANDLDNPSNAFCDVYTAKEMKHYKCSELIAGNYTLVEETPHYYGMVPITVFELNDDRVSIFDRILTLQDAYNKLISADVDDYEAFVDAFLALQGLEGTDTETIQQMKEDRVLLLPEDSNAFWITKGGSTQEVNSLLDRIKDEIQRIAKCPDFNDEKFMAQSGVAIRYKLVGMENQASSIESNMRKALQNRLELICQIQNLTAEATAWRDIELVFTRNLPLDLTDIINLVNALRGLVSDRTLLGQIPFIKDIDQELLLLEEQKAQERDSVYDFTYTDEEDERTFEDEN